MRILDIQTAVIEANYDWTIVKVITDEKIVGYGEAFFAPGLTALIQELKTVLIGEDPRNVDRLFRRMRTATIPGGMTGMVLHAITGIETALLDVVGKRLKTPVYQLLGGKYRDKIRIYADCHGGDGLESLSPVLLTRTPSWSSEESKADRNDEQELSMKYHGGKSAEAGKISPEDYAKQARKMAEKGFTALKFDIDVPNPYSLDDFNRTLTGKEIHFMVQLVSAVREAVGDEVDVAIDCHWNYNVNDALKLAEELENFNLLWLEDPTPPENIDALKWVTHETRVPIASGENHYLRHQFAKILQHQAVNILSPDFHKVGGLLEARRIADLADMNNVAVAPHNIASPIGTMAAAHVCGAIPNFHVLEWHSASVPFWSELAKGDDGPLIEQGYLTLDEKPGLGVELDEEVAYRYKKHSESFFD
ncbi:MAG TPA: mandelate racemase/muconate lactonizing enzyme family protein [Bacillales bacterium]|nr:mandelate racemase/muconate lactonizing enzyme family protein [Bacillales bacterium]